MKDNLEFLKKAEEIMNNANCYNGIEDEILKLYILFSRCCPSKKEGNNEFLSREYVGEKVYRLMKKIPIVLDDGSKRIYASLKLCEEETETTTTHQENS